jgi:hypothetical protein
MFWHKKWYNEYEIQTQKMALDQNERVEEWFLIVGDWVRDTPKIWFYALIGILVVAIPLYMFVDLMFERILVNSIVPIRVNYQEVSKLPLEIIDRKIFALENGTYSGYIRVKNPNSDWGVPSQAYNVDFKNASGDSVMNTNGSTFILPASEKNIVFPRFSASSAPTRLDFTLSDTTYTRPPNLPTLSLEIQRRSFDSMVNQSTVNAVIVNRTPFKIARVDLPVLLFDAGGQVIGANYTNINDLASAESRSFQYVWYNRINNVARVEIIPELNIFNRDIFVTGPGQNPFDDLE